MIIRRLAALAAVLGLAACATQGRAPTFPAVTDFGTAGPFLSVSKAEGPDCTIYRPQTLGEGGLKHPIILWGNGTGQRPTVYGQMLTHWSTHGFVVAAANTTNAGNGTEMLACLDWLTEQNAAAGNPYSGNLDLTKVGTSGHSQGGGGSIMAARDPRVVASAPVQPYTIGLRYVLGAEIAQHGPMLLLSGGGDTIAGPERNQLPIFQKTNVPVFWASLNGAGHLVPMRTDSGEFRVITTAWFRAKLMNDPLAATWFDVATCVVCASQLWTIQRRDGA